MKSRLGYQIKNLDISDNFITDASGVKLAEAINSVPRLETLNLSRNTLTEVSAAIFVDEIRTHQRLHKLDLTTNLVPLRFIHEINKRCYQNNDKGDDKRVPNLRKALSKEILHSTSNLKVNLIQQDYRHAQEKRGEYQVRCTQAKDNFWAVYDGEH